MTLLGSINKNRLVFDINKGNSNYLIINRGDLEPKVTQIGPSRC